MIFWDKTKIKKIFGSFFKSMSKTFVPLQGGYQQLLSFQKAEIIYQGTVYFTNRFYSKKDRTVDQMVQAARSGKRNIAEASVASATSKEKVLRDQKDFNFLSL